MRNKVAGGEVVIRHGGIPMSGRHDERHGSSIGSLRSTLATLLCINGGFHSARQGRIFDHFPELVDVVGTVVAVLAPYIQELLQPSMMFGVLLSIVRCRITHELDDIRLQGTTQRRKSNCSVGMILGVME